MKRKYTQEMYLLSDSGYSMPYSSAEGEPRVLLGYGRQRHPENGETFTHHGIDLTAGGVRLLAMASGKVSGLGNDPVHEGFVNVRYGDYEVEYGHITEVFADFGSKVEAGQVIATAGDILHLGVRYKGEEIDPGDFLQMVYNNAVSASVAGIGETADNVDVKTDYDDDMPEISCLMVRYMPLYMDDLRKGSYKPKTETERKLQDVLAQSARKNYYFEALPSEGNPLGLSVRSAPLVGIVQSLLIGDFLNYLAVRHDIFLKGWDEAKKKSFWRRRRTGEDLSTLCAASM